MTKAFSRLLAVLFPGICLVPLVATVCSRITDREQLGGRFAGMAVVYVLLLGLATVAFSWLLRASHSRLEDAASEQSRFLSGFSDKYVDIAICGSAALSLFLELTVIRWQGTIYSVFALYKNFTLLACFAGLGLGYALAGRDRIPLSLTMPLLAAQLAFLTFLRGMSEWRMTESLNVVPVREQLVMGRRVATSLWQGLGVYTLLAVIFLLTALAFIPVGQLCGRMMERREKLKAYGLNLLGSLLGVGLMFLSSWLWMPPVVWFTVCFLGLVMFHVRRRSSLLTAISVASVGIIAIAWPVQPMWRQIYSPYQLVEIGQNPQGLMLIKAAGHYFQNVHDLAATNRNVDTNPKLRSIRAYYELPYRIHGNPQEVAIVGAGSGNDVAAALRMGVQRIDAIEIDPAVLMAGRVGHPEHPYSDSRVHAIVNDARSFLRTTDHTYDMVIYGLLDSHTLLSQGSSVRLDSFVYTVQGLKEARSRLKPGGILSLSFAVINDELGRKLYLMMQEAFDGKPPVCVYAGYDGARIFLQSREGDLRIAPSVLEQSGFEDRTAYYGSAAINADVSTDDWPFFYMPRRVYPKSYLIMIAIVLVLSVAAVVSFFSEAPKFSHLPFFFLGAGFMLVETKGITELGLTFGNSWQVIAVVIASILLMAFLANCVVDWLKIRRAHIPYALLIASLGLGLWIAHSGGFPSTTMGRMAAAVVLTCPMFFSGMVFSTLLRSTGEISGMMAMNLLGAMFGGVLEYNSMYFGFQALYVLAIVLYVFALVFSLRPFERNQAAAVKVASSPST